MPGKMDFDAFEAKVAKDGLTAAELRSTLKAAGLPTTKFKPGRTFPIGIIINDGVRVSYDLTPEQTGPMVTSLAAGQVQGVRSWRVFPLGIIAPERFKVEVDVGRPFANR